MKHEEQYHHNDYGIKEMNEEIDKIKCYGLDREEFLNECHKFLNITYPEIFLEIYYD